MRLKTKYHILSICLLLSGITACTFQQEKNTEEENVATVLPNETTEVQIQTLALADFNHELISNGKLSAQHFAELKFETAEPIAAIYVKNGDRVTKGQKIAELSAFRLSNKTASAKTALESAKLELQDVLIGQGYRLEDSTRVPTDIMQLVRIRSGYEQAWNALQLAQYEEQHAVLTAPFDGVIANLTAKTHNTASTSEVFCSVIDTRSLEACFTVLESELPLIKEGDFVRVTPFAWVEGNTEGRVTAINPMVDKDGMVQVRAAVTSKNNLFEGMNVQVSVRRSVGKQLVVPKSAVVLRSGKQVVFTLVDGKAYWNYVHTGLENSDSYTITEGLKEGDQVITSGNINLAHESPVKVIE